MRSMHRFGALLVVGVIQCVWTADGHAATTSVTESWLVIQDISRSKAMVLPSDDPGSKAPAPDPQGFQAARVDHPSQHSSNVGPANAAAPNSVPTDGALGLPMDLEPVSARSGIQFIIAPTAVTPTADGGVTPDAVERGASLAAMEAVMLVIAALIVLALHLARRRDAVRR